MLDGALMLKSILSENWRSNNTDMLTPEFAEYYEKRRIPRNVSSSDWVLIYDRLTSESPTTIGNDFRRVIYRCSVDIRTDESKSHIKKLEEEVKRIIRENVNYYVPKSSKFGTYNQFCVLEIKNTQNFSNSENDTNFKNFRKVIEVDITCDVEVV